MEAKRRAVFRGVAVLTALAIVALLPNAAVHAQAATAFSPSQTFSIPDFNSNIAFTINGTYQQAALVNDSWVFTNLTASDTLGALNVTVSAVDCNITVTRCSDYYVTIPATRLSYIVQGQGNQTFHVSPLPSGGEWSVFVNRDFAGENEGFTLARDGSITIIKPPSGANITITHFVFPEDLGGGNDTNLPWLQRHSVALATGAAVAAAVAVAVALALVNRKRQSQAAATRPKTAKH